MVLYTDDMLLYRRIDSTKDFTVLQQDINTVNNCVKEIYLTFNSTKCKFMLISRKREYHHPVPNLLLDDVSLKRVDCFKYLGILLTADLRWSRHIETICNKARKLLGLLYCQFYEHTRPFGGCAILYRKSLTSHIVRLNCPSKRFCALLLTDNVGVSTLLICVYLPFNDGSSGSHNDFLIVLSELEGFIDRHNFDHLLVAGDFNVDFDRNSPVLRHLQNFMSDFHLVSADRPFQSEIQYTYMRDDGCASSWPDHYLCDSSLASSLSSFQRFDFGSNLSDHSPLICSIISLLHLSGISTPFCLVLSF